LTLAFLYSFGRVNLPAITAIVAMATLLSIYLCHRRLPAAVAKRRARTLAFGFVIFALGSVAAALFVDASFSPSAQVQARYDPMLASLVLGTLMVLTTRLPPRSADWIKAPVFVTILAFAVAQVVADLNITSRWRLLFADFESRLAGSKGLVPWAATLSTGDAARDRNWRLLSIDWVTPIISIHLAKDGKVCTIIDYPPGSFRPIEPANPPPIPGVNYDCYRAALAGAAK
jgi:hypothetical protein